MRLTERTAQSFGIYLADTGERERVVERRIGDGWIRPPHDPGHLACRPRLGGAYVCARATVAAVNARA